MVKPQVPTAYELAVLAGDQPAFRHAVAAAAAGAEDGTLFWRERAHRLELALVLEPEADLKQTLRAFYAFQVACGDALGAYTEAAYPLALRWPLVITFDMFELARTPVAWPRETAPEDRPPWIVFGLEAEVSEPDPDHERPDRISLRGAGALEVPVARFVEAVARHFLFWFDRLEQYGFAVIQRAWNERCDERGQSRCLQLGTGTVVGTVGGLDEAGCFRLGERAIGLWELPPALLAGEEVRV